MVVSSQRPACKPRPTCVRARACVPGSWCVCSQRHASTLLYKRRKVFQHRPRGLGISMVGTSPACWLMQAERPPPSDQAEHSTHHRGTDDDLRSASPGRAALKPETPNKRGGAGRGAGGWGSVITKVPNGRNGGSCWASGRCACQGWVQVRRGQELPIRSRRGTQGIVV